MIDAFVGSEYEQKEIQGVSINGVECEREQKEILGVSIYEGYCKNEVTIVIYKCVCRRRKG